MNAIEGGRGMGFHTPDGAQSPSEVRLSVALQHKILRKGLVALQSMARATALDEERALELCATLCGFIDDFAQHLAYEDRALMPLVEDMPRGGPMRAAQMRSEHFMQRNLLSDIQRKAAAVTCACALEFAIAVDALVLQILADMREEEEAILKADDLRDDLVSIDQTSG